MPSNDRELWVAILSDNGSEELNYLTYAKYSFEKYEWYDLFEKHKGKPPTAAEIDDWISQITAVRIRTWRENAARAFDVAARDYMKNQIMQERRDAVNDRIVTSIEDSLTRYDTQFRECLTEVRNSSSLRNQILVGFVTALLSPLILGLGILAIQAADLWPAPTGINMFFHPRTSETPPKPASGR
jgi:hypothetical protein